jgi:hypothetical protein
MQQLLNFIDEKNQYENWLNLFDHQKKEFDGMQRELFEKEKELIQISSKKRLTLAEVLVGRPLRKCEEKYFTNRYKEFYL